jgi:hypothetical protein
MFSWEQILNKRYPITKLYPFYKNDGTRELIAVSNKRLYRYTEGHLFYTSDQQYGGFDQTANNYPEQLSSNTARFLTYKDRNIADMVLIADGGKLKAYDGSNVKEVVNHTPTDGTSGTPLETTDPGLNDLVNLTNFRTMALKKDRVFAAAHPTVKNRVSFCYFDPYLGYAVYDYWPATYFFDVAVEDNDEIVELKVFRNVLVIFCKRSIWVLKGDGANLTDLELVKINVPKGCISPDSICEVGNNLFYLGDDHIYSLYSTDQEYLSAQIMSTAIKPILKSIGVTDKAKAVAIFHDNNYYLSFPSGLTLVYDITLECWTKYTNVQANSFVVLDGVLYFSTDKGILYQFNENLYVDDYKAINFFIKTKMVDMELPVHQKKFRKLWVITKQWDNYNSTLDIKAVLDRFASVEIDKQENNTEGGVWDESIFDQAVWDFAEVTQNIYKFREKGKNVQFLISNNIAGEPLSVYEIITEYQQKKAK